MGWERRLSRLEKAQKCSLKDPKTPSPLWTDASHEYSWVVGSRNVSEIRLGRSGVGRRWDQNDSEDLVVPELIETTEEKSENLGRRRGLGGGAVNGTETTTDGDNTQRHLYIKGTSVLNI